MKCESAGGLSTSEVAWDFLHQLQPVADWLMQGLHMGLHSG